MNSISTPGVFDSLQYPTARYRPPTPNKAIYNLHLFIITRVKLRLDIPGVAGKSR